MTAQHLLLLKCLQESVFFSFLKYLLPCVVYITLQIKVCLRGFKACERFILLSHFMIDDAIS